MPNKRGMENRGRRLIRCHLFRDTLRFLRYAECGENILDGQWQTSRRWLYELRIGEVAYLDYIAAVIRRYG